MRSVIILCLLLFTSPLWADQLIIEPDMGTQPLLNAIDKTKHSLNLVMYGFTEQSLLDAILKKHQQGKSIKIILEASPYKAEQENNKVINALNQHGITWQGHIPPFRLIHQKTFILDDNQAIVMTFNFTHATFKNERNFGLIIDDPKRVNAIAAIFSADWNHVPVNNTDADLIISPENSRDKILSLVLHAKHSIKIYAQGLNDYKVIGALANAARRSSDVQIITSNHLRDKQAKYLQRAGVNIHYTKKLIIHAKVFIIDNQLAVLGSINLTRSSLDDNRELSVITRDKQVIAELNETFKQDWENQPAIQPWIPDKPTLKQVLRILNKITKEAL